MDDKIDERRFKLAWEHFRFHAEQRTRMFHFFLLTVALLLNAFSLLLRADNAVYHDYAFIVLSIGGIFSTVFFALDVRNTQLLEYSEALLRKIEDELYSNEQWREEVNGGAIKLGLLSREAVLKDYVKKNLKTRSNLFWRWFFVDNLKHKLAIRLIVVFSIIGFWSAAWAMTPSDHSYSRVFIWIFILISGAWIVNAMWSPTRDKKREQHALQYSQTSTTTQDRSHRQAESGSAGDNAGVDPPGS